MSTRASKRRRESSTPPPIICFYKVKDPHGFFSNWSPHAIESGDEVFKTAEHALMHAKALMMGDAETAAKILEAPSPYLAKKLGREVKDYDEAKWVAGRRAAMVRILRRKASQHDEIRYALEDTRDARLVEASPLDSVWGSGCGTKQAMTGKFKGENLLGQCWEQVRGDMF
ncbi:MAG: NADAR family protein [Solirubrobacterales bacterium]